MNRFLSLTRTLRISSTTLNKAFYATEGSVGGHSQVVPQNLNSTETLLGSFLNIIGSPLHLLGNGFIIVPAQHVAVMTKLGKCTGRHCPEGTTWVPDPIGLKLHTVFIGDSSMKLENSKIIDKSGNPVVVSGVINYNILHPERYALGIRDPKKYIYNQSDAVLKSVISKYSYDDLRSENALIQSELKEKSQNVLNIAGVNVTDFTLTDMNYAKEIAQSMLVKQQAQAYAEAKKHIAEASNEIISGVTDKYKGILTKEDQADLIKKLLVVITSGSSVQPTLPVDH